MKSLLLTTILGVFFIFTSCENSNVINTNENEIEILKESTYSINAYNPDYIEIGDYSDIYVKVTRDSAKSQSNRNIFNGIIKRMNLDSNQTIFTNRLLEKHRSCIQSCLHTIKVREKEIIDSAKVLREEIKTKLDSNLISKVEARTQIRLHNASIIKQLKSLNESFKVRECMEMCDREFIQALLPILNPIQLEQFNKWIHHNRIGYERKRTKDSIDIKRDSVKGRG